MNQHNIPERLFFTHSERALEAFREAVRQELLKRKRLGLSASEWRDGKLVIVPPEEIPVDDEPPRPAKAAPAAVPTIERMK